MEFENQIRSIAEAMAIGVITAEEERSPQGMTVIRYIAIESGVDANTRELTEQKSKIQEIGLKNES